MYSGSRGAGESWSPKGPRLSPDPEAGSGGPGVSPEEMLCPWPPVKVLTPLLLPPCPAATTHALGHTEGSLLMLKGPCVSLPAGASPGLPSSRQPKHTQPHPHPTQEAAGRPPCRGHACALLQMGMASVAVCWGFKCFGKLLGGGPTPWGSPGKPPSCCVSKSSHACSQKAPPRKPPFSCHRGGPRSPPHQGEPPGSPLQGRASHATAGRDLAAVPEPGHLWPWEAGDAWGADDSCFSVGDTLVLLAFLKAPHVCRREERVWGSDCPAPGLGVAAAG